MPSCQKKKKPLKLKTCIVCEKDFEPKFFLQKTCGLKCAIEQVNIINAKKSDKAKLESLKTLSDHLKETQTEVNAYIRERDKKLPCISCGKAGKKRNAGHYRSIGAAPQLRFNEDNIHGQCEHCNTFKSGNAIEYRINLVKKIGVERVEVLEQNNVPAKFTIEDAKRIKKEFKKKRKTLQSV